MRLTFLLVSILLMTAASAAAVEYPLRVSEDGRHLIDARGDEVVFNGATPWHLAARLTREEVIEYLDARKLQGTDALLMALMVTDGYATASTANAYGEEPFMVPGDFTQPNPAYFEHVHWVIEQARLRGMTMFIAPVYLGWECGTEGWCAEVKLAGAETMRAFGRWVGYRFGDQPNIVWVLGGDVDAAAYGALELVDALAEGIKEYDPVHLQTAHCGREFSGRDCYDRPWLDFDSTYSSCDRTPAEVREDYLRFPWMPTVYLEGIYEFEYEVTPECIRAQAWWAALGGLGGHFFGSGKIWDFPAHWRDGLFTEGTDSMENFERILRARGWATLVPDYEHLSLVAGYGNIEDSSYAAAAIRSDRNSLLVYVPTPRTVTVAMNRVEGVEADVWWIDPARGEGTYVGRFPTTGTLDFSTPGLGDWVLIVDNADASLADVWLPSTAAPASPTRSRVELMSASPNPFNPRTVIEFAGPAGEQVEVAVYDARGRRIQELFHGPATGSLQTLTWRPQDLASGTYFVQVTGAGQSSTRKVVLLK